MIFHSLRIWGLKFNHIYNFVSSYVEAFDSSLIETSFLRSRLLSLINKFSYREKIKKTMTSSCIHPSNRFIRLNMILLTYLTCYTFAIIPSMYQELNQNLPHKPLCVTVIEWNEEAGLVTRGRVIKFGESSH